MYTHIHILSATLSLQWHHNGHSSVSNHQPHDCLLHRLFRRRSKKTSKLRVTGLCAGNSPGTGEFSAQMASNAENVSIWWRRHVTNSERFSTPVICSSSGSHQCNYANSTFDWPPVTHFTKEVNSRLAKRPLVFNRPLAISRVNFLSKRCHSSVNITVLSYEYQGTSKSLTQLFVKKLVRTNIKESVKAGVCSEHRATNSERFLKFIV